ncbi:CoA transferase [Amycolatopsis sp. NPDC051372]|uniref:CoA transferase n=1 Tax=Amycolatopsis sp. NPDC051372 TaxID=3155669 RepID=UPI00343FC40E
MQAISYLMLGHRQPRTGNRDPYSGPAGIFEASDGYLYLHAGTDSLFARLARAMDNPDLIEDERFRSTAARMANIDAVEKIVTGWLGTRGVEGACEALDAAGIPYSKVADIDEVTQNEQLRSREMLVEVDHSEAGRVVVPGVVVKLSRTPGSVQMPPPTVGQHNDDVLAGVLGKSGEAIDELRATGVI